MTTTTCQYDFEKFPALSYKIHTYHGIQYDNTT
jgi:hypothetical protein